MMCFFSQHLIAEIETEAWADPKLLLGKAFEPDLIETQMKQKNEIFDDLVESQKRVRKIKVKGLGENKIKEGKKK